MGDSGKIRKVSAFMQVCCLGVAALLVVFQLFFLIIINVNPAMIMPVLTEREAVVAIAEADTLNAILASLFYMLPSLLVSYGFWHLSRTFKLYREGEYFSDESVSHLLVFSVIGFVTQLIKPVLMGIAGTVARLGGEENSFSLSITIDQQGITQLLAWGTFLVIAWVLREGVRVAQENAEFL